MRKILFVQPASNAEMMLVTDWLRVVADPVGYLNLHYLDMGFSSLEECLIWAKERGVRLEKETKDADD